MTRRESSSEPARPRTRQARGRRQQVGDGVAEPLPGGRVLSPDGGDADHVPAASSTGTWADDRRAPPDVAHNARPARAVHDAAVAELQLRAQQGRVGGRDDGAVGRPATTAERRRPVRTDSAQRQRGPLARGSARGALADGRVAGQALGGGQRPRPSVRSKLRGRLGSEMATTATSTAKTISNCRTRYCPARDSSASSRSARAAGRRAPPLSNRGVPVTTMTSTFFAYTSVIPVTASRLRRPATAQLRT